MSDDNIIIKPNARTITIAAQNDLFRTTFDRKLGVVTLTQAVNALDDMNKTKLINLIRDFTIDSHDGNDPYSEHDFGAVELNGEKYFFKIDYYDKTLKFGSEDPANLEMTKRVMTIMHSRDY